MGFTVIQTLLHLLSILAVYAYLVYACCIALSSRGITYKEMLWLKNWTASLMCRWNSLFSKFQSKPLSLLPALLTCIQYFYERCVSWHVLVVCSRACHWAHSVACRSDRINGLQALHLQPGVTLLPSTCVSEQLSSLQTHLTDTQSSSSYRPTDSTLEKSLEARKSILEENQ